MNKPHERGLPLSRTQRTVQKQMAPLESALREILRHIHEEEMRETYIWRVARKGLGMCICLQSDDDECPIHGNGNV